MNNFVFLPGQIEDWKIYIEDQLCLGRSLSRKRM
jgi:hypothetical protein